MGMPVSLTMSQTGVRLSLLLSLLTITISSGCTDYICRHEYPDGKSVTKIPVNLGDRCAYFTQEPGRDYYPPPRGVSCITKSAHGQPSQDGGWHGGGHNLHRWGRCGRHHRRSPWRYRWYGQRRTERGQPGWQRTWRAC